MIYNCLIPLVLWNIHFQTAKATHDGREVNVYFYSQHHQDYGKVYQMAPALGYVTEEGFSLVDGSNASPGGVTYIRGYHSQEERYYGDSDNFTKLRICRMEQTSKDGDIMTFHTLFRYDCQDILDFIPQGTYGTVSELARIDVPSEGNENTQIFRAVLCQGHNDLLYGFVTKSFPYCPDGHFKLHEFVFNALGGGLHCPEIVDTPGMEIYYEIEHDAWKKTALVTCNPPFRLNTTEWPPFQGSRQCSDNGRWIGEELGCEYINCGNPPEIPNGHYNGSSYGYKGQVNLVCDPGYEYELLDLTIKSSDALSLRCGNSSKWSSILSGCKAKDCGAPPIIQHGSYEGDSRVYPSTLQLVCDVGFTKTSENIQHCTVDGQWSDLETTCEPVNCGRPKNVPERGYFIGDHFGYKDMVALVCQQGYFFSNRYNFIRCLANGEWEEINGECERIVCDTLLAPKNGTLIAENFEYEAQANFMCDYGFNLIGNESLRCVDVDGMGVWSSEPPYCRITDCGEPINKIADSISANEDTTLHSVVSYKCEPGYQLKTLSQCTPGGWSDTEIICERSPICNLTELEPVPFARFNISGIESDSHSGVLVHHGFGVSYSCIEDYEITGSNYAVCLANSSWFRPSDIKCVAQNKHGNVRIAGNSPYEGLVEVFMSQSGSWQKICRLGFNTAAAQVVCHQLGLSGGQSINNYGSYSNTYIYLDQIECTGNEDRLIDCSLVVGSRSGSHYAAGGSHSYSYNAGVRCDSPN